jgi:hypothetical protein
MSFGLKGLIYEHDDYNRAVYRFTVVIYVFAVSTHIFLYFYMALVGRKKMKDKNLYSIFPTFLVS